MNYFNYSRNGVDNSDISHTHEFFGNTTIDEIGKDAHNHHVSGVSSKAISVPGGHIHEIVSNTTFDDEHIHKLTASTGVQISVGNNRHVHFIEGITSTDDNHNHNVEFSTLI